MSDLVTLSHDRGMLSMLQGLLAAYHRTMSPDKPVRAKMIADALALVQAVREETIIEQQDELTALNSEVAILREIAANAEKGPYGEA